MMMKKIMLMTALALTAAVNGFSQLYNTRTGFVGFYSKTPLEDIKAENSQVYAVIDAGKKNLAFTLLLKGFIFPKQLMQEHFNENYVESDKYPKASFSGAYTGDVDLTKEAVYNVTIKGNMLLHGVTKNIEIPATLEVKGGKLLGHAQFKMKPEDYNITIPSLVREKIAPVMNVNVQIECTTAK